MFQKHVKLLLTETHNPTRSSDLNSKVFLLAFYNLEGDRGMDSLCNICKQLIKRKIKTEVIILLITLLNAKILQGKKTVAELAIRGYLSGQVKRTPSEHILRITHANGECCQNLTSFTDVTYYHRPAYVQRASLTLSSLHPLFAPIACLQCLTVSVF